MTVQELITQINIESNEILDEPTEYIQYINAAIDWLTMILVSIRDREVVKNIDVQNLRAVPSDFMSFVPKSGYPIRIINGTFQTYDGEQVEEVFYSTKKSHVDSFDDAIPFSESFHSYLIQLVSFMVKKKSLMTDYASFDKSFIDYLTELIKQARGIA